MATPWGFRARWPAALRTLKQRSRGKGRPRAGDTVKLARGARIWPVTDQTVRNWLKEADTALRGRGVHLVVPLTPHVFRHSYAISNAYRPIWGIDRSNRPRSIHRCLRSMRRRVK